MKKKNELFELVISNINEIKKGLIIEMHNIINQL